MHLNYLHIFICQPCDVLSQDGYTALMLASNNGHTETVRVLLNHPQIDISIQDSVSLVQTVDVTSINFARALPFLYLQGGNTALSLAENDEIKSLVSVQSTS